MCKQIGLLTATVGTYPNHPGRDFGSDKRGVRNWQICITRKTILIHIVILSAAMILTREAK